ncbi:hypothetical protein LDENG_00120980 [Lucifuga dentata]|nr:hypothetical protein LDENG_00120980 [Lucifuga dentata]
MSLRSSGTTCAVRGCTYNQAKLNEWLKLECFEHKPKTKSDCSCRRWYSFHRIPKDDESKRNWLKNLNLKKPPKTLYVCSFHFVDKKPTQDNPYPTLFLGAERPPEKRRRRTGTQRGTAGKANGMTTRWLAWFILRCFVLFFRS